MRLRAPATWREPCGAARGTFSGGSPTDSLAAVTDDAETPADDDGPALAPDGIPLLPPEVTSRQQELRDLVDAGAASPEELRALAEKLKEQRLYEQSRWKEDVRPALMKAKKRRFNLLDLRKEPVEADKSALPLALGLVAGVIVLIFLASQTSFLLLVVAALGVLVYAWVHGTKSDPSTADQEPPTDAVD